MASHRAVAWLLLGAAFLLWLAAQQSDARAELRPAPRRRPPLRPSAYRESDYDRLARLERHLEREAPPGDDGTRAPGRAELARSTGLEPFNVWPEQGAAPRAAAPVQQQPRPDKQRHQQDVVDERHRARQRVEPVVGEQREIGEQHHDGGRLQDLHQIPHRDIAPDRAMQSEQGEDHQRQWHQNQRRLQPHVRRDLVAAQTVAQDHRPDEGHRRGSHIPGKAHVGFETQTHQRGYPGKGAIHASYHAKDDW